MIKHLLLDFDRTLNDSDRVYERNLHGFLGLSGQDVLQHWEAIHRDILAKEPRERHEDLDLHYQRMLESWRLHDPAEMKAELRRRIRGAQQECWDATALFDDALPFLLRMKDAGYTLHIATGDYAQQKAEAIELQAGRSLFTRAFDESVLGVGKGRRDYFDRLLGRLEATSYEAIVFGDSLANDIGPARQAGIPAVWVRRKNEKLSESIAPDLTLTSLAEGLASFTGQWSMPLSRHGGVQLPLAPPSQQPFPLPAALPVSHSGPSGFQT